MTLKVDLTVGSAEEYERKKNIMLQQLFTGYGANLLLIEHHYQENILHWGNLKH
jgi:hypothetical protein